MLAFQSFRISTKTGMVSHTIGPTLLEPLTKQIQWQSRMIENYSTTLLITQNFLEIVCIFIVALLLRGTVKDCLNLKKTVKFAPAGACFGIQAVFGFFAMSEMTADAYALYAQTSIIVLTLAWCIMFRTRLPGTAWCGIFAIAIGMIGFNMSDKTTTPTGLVFIGLKILTQCFACIYAEIFMKTDPESLYIQMAWIKPVELLVTCMMTFVMSNIFPRRADSTTGLSSSFKI